MEISGFLDEGKPLSDHVRAHVHGCAECEAFLSFWTEGMGRNLAQPLPAADIALREKILLLPQEVHAAGVSSRVKRFHYRGVLSAAAAVAVFGLTTYALLDVRRAPDHVTTVQSDGGAKKLAGKLAKHELNALRADLRKGASALRGPVSVLNRVLD